MLYQLQNFFVQASPGLIPLLIFPLSLIQGWHCTAMCSAFFSSKGRSERSSYLMGRTLSYSFVGALFGSFGEQLRRSLEFETLGGLSLVFFFFLTAALSLFWFGGPRLREFLKSLRPTMQFLWISRATKKSAFFQGFLSVTLPCGLLYQIFTLSAISHSVTGGFLIGLAHASTTTLHLQAGSRFFHWLQSRSAQKKLWVQGLLFFLVLLNSLYFLGVFLHSAEIAPHKFLFCL